MNEFISNSPHGKDFFEGKSQQLVAKAIYESINNVKNLPHIIGLEGDWGSGKSNVIKQLSDISGFDRSYYLFTYDAWGHQEDLQRRSILEVLTTELIKKEFLVGKGKVRLRNGDEKEDSWNSLLSYLLSNKTVTTTKPNVKVSSFTLVMLAVVCIANVTSTICSDRFDDDNGYIYWVLLLAPYFIGLVLIGAFAMSSCSWNFLKHWVTKEDAEKVTEEYVSNEEPSIQEFRNWMQAISDYIDANHKQKLILVFDNMDRLSPEKVRQLWSSIYAFFAGEVFGNIWVIIPYDEKRLVAAFSESEEESGDNFIKKTFSMVYRVSPPVISDYELLFKSYFEQAFGNHEDENKINQIFRVLNHDPNPRDVIYFLNQMVALVRMWGNVIPLADIALYVCRKTKHHRGNMKLDAYLLSNAIFEDVEALFVHQERTKVNLTKLAYGLTNDELARQLPMRNYLRAYFEQRDNRDINEFATQPHFVTVLTDVINDAPLTLVNKYILGLGNLSEDKLSDADKLNVRHKWDWLANQWKKNDIDKQSFSNEPRLLLSHCSDKYKYKLVENVVYKLQHYNNFKGKDYYNAMNELRQFVDDNNIEYNFSTCDKVETTAEVFWDYLHVAKDNYLDFNLSTSSNELMAFLADSNLKTCKIANLVEYLANDSNYDFLKLLEFCKKLISAGEVEKDNICTLLYFESFVYSIIKKQPVPKIELPVANVISNLYSDVYGQDLYSRLSGYWDFVFLLMNWATETPDVDDANIEDLAKVSVKYECFNDVFVNLDSIYSVRQKLAKSIIQQHLVGSLDVVKKIKDFSAIQVSTTLPWNEILDYFSLYVNSILKEDRDEVKEDFSSYVPSDIFPYLKKSDSAIVKWIVTIGREYLEKHKPDLVDSNGSVVHGYWQLFVDAFLGTNVWAHTDGYVLQQLKRVFELYCTNHDVSLIQDEFVENLVEKINEEDYLPLVNQARNSFTVGSCHASIDEFKYFVHYIPKLDTEIPNVDTFVQNFIEYAFLNDSASRILVYNNSKFYMPLINQSYRIMKYVIKYIAEHKDSEAVCAKLYDQLSDEAKDSLISKGEDN